MSPGGIIKILETGFLPLRCVAEMWDYGKRIQIKIFDLDDKPTLSYPDQIFSSIQTLESCRGFISMTRGVLRNKGFKLD